MVTVRQVKAARVLLGWSQDDLAEKSGVSKPTIGRLESREGEFGGYEDTRTAIIEALQSAGIIFIDGNGDGPGVRLKRFARRPNISDPYPR
jgi:transcriptional regulator with XRE-family HTH domain